ncbi:class I SAM-dependent methyltransferase [Candidatus Pelagibacter sp.]|nr:class I SAM-dependent methyltransferase [Candidatus Pelagibacter sp.]
MSLKNWDNKTWLSSTSYIKSFNKFLIKETKLNKNSAILDIGCGRGKILGNLTSKLGLIKKPIGIDIEQHKDRDKRIIFKKTDAINYLKKNRKKFDLILLKQTIHFLPLKDIKKLLLLCVNCLNSGGRIAIFTLTTSNNEIPTFVKMKKKLGKSLQRDQKILRFINVLYPGSVSKTFSFKVKISREKYVEMIKNRYISTLLNLSNAEILKGISEINRNYRQRLNFKDKLICLILKK